MKIVFSSPDGKKDTDYIFTKFKGIPICFDCLEICIFIYGEDSYNLLSGKMGQIRL